MSYPVTPPSCPPPRPNPPPPRGEGPEIGALVKRRLPETGRDILPDRHNTSYERPSPLGGRVVGDGGRTGGGWHSRCRGRQRSGLANLTPVDFDETLLPPA